MAHAVERPALEPSACAGLVVRKRRAGEHDAGLRDRVLVLGIGEEGPVGSCEVRRERGPWAGGRPVEAPDLLHGAIPELEQVDAVRILDPLSEIERRRAVRLTVEPLRTAV